MPERNIADERKIADEQRNIAKECKIAPLQNAALSFQHASNELKGPRKVEYVIFDVDGLLIDTDKMYAEVIGEVIGQYGKVLTWDMRAHLSGGIAHINAAYVLSCYPDVPLSVDDFLVQYDAGLLKRFASVDLLPGALKLVHHLHTHSVPIAIATGSRRKMFLAKMQSLQDTLLRYFGARVVCGDDFPARMRGKPEPDMFLLAARELLSVPVGCPDGPCTEEERTLRSKGLVFEDAIFGIKAGKRAGMAVVWVPEAGLLEVGCTGDEQPDLTLATLEDFVPEEWGLPPYE